MMLLKHLKLTRTIKGTASMLRTNVREVKQARMNFECAVSEFLMRIAIILIKRENNFAPLAAIENNLQNKVGQKEILLWERAIRLSYASYAVSFPSILHKRMGAPSDKISVCVRKSATPLVPAYMLALNHADNEIILSIRGTSGLRDIMSCINFGP
mmetsp:Transcript_17297/g.24499  ORF Transcript_17297/g.24499 Transcript_17297/m.24499 type:complete len:156 (-) Transcript_17297:21-488(-)